MRTARRFSSTRPGFENYFRRGFLAGGRRFDAGARSGSSRNVQIRLNSLRGVLEPRKMGQRTFITTPSIMDDDDGKMDSATSPKKSMEEKLMDLETLLERIEQKDKLLNVEDCYLVMEAWMEEAMAQNANAACQAKRILEALEANRIWNSSQAQQPTVLIPPKASFYDVVLHAFAVCGGGYAAAESAEHLLDQMLAQCRRHQNMLLLRRWKRGSSSLRGDHELQQQPPPPEPTSKTFTIVVNAWSRSGVEDAGPRAEAILSKMARWRQECEEAKECYSGSLPHGRVWSSVMNAWSRHSTPQSRKRVVELLHKMKADHDEAKKADENGTSDVEGLLDVDAVVCNIALKVFVDRSLGKDGALQAEQLLKFYQKWHELDPRVSAPNTRSYTLLLDAWAQCRTEEGALRAQEILDTMIHLYRQGDGVLPNRVTFTACISAWARLKKVTGDIPENAELILMRLVEMYEQSGDEELRPDTDACNIVMSAWIRAMDRPDAMDRARQVFEKARRYAKPDIVTYNTFLDGLSKRGHSSDALAMLRWLESDATLINPDRISYNTVIRAISRDRAGKPRDALAVLGRMKQNHSSPDKKTYTAVLSCWANSSATTLRDAKTAAALVEEMETNAATHHNPGDELKPDAFLVTMLIRVCAQVNGPRADRQEALQVAFEMKDKLIAGNYGRMSWGAYEAVLSSICMLCDSEDEKLQNLHSVFDRCAEEGFVSEKVVRLMVSGGAWQETTRFEDLRESWSSNVPTRYQPTTNPVDLEFTTEHV